jgi:hypothetical protein
MFGWLRRKKEFHKPVIPPERVANSAKRRPVQSYIYPPVASGIPRFPVPGILEEHEELIQRIRHLSEDKSVFDERYRAVIERFADYVYLLPASESHHHRGAGGLLRHGLETAKYVLQQSYDRLHGMEMSPQRRKAARERWLFAGFIAGLNHDIGKAAADMRVFSVSGNVWEPYSEPLTLWYQELPLQDDRIYVSWRREDQDHRRTAVHLMRHIVTPGDLAYLTEIEPNMMDQIYQAILGEKGVRNDLPEMVQEADRKSVALDLQKSNVLSDLGPEVGQPLARHFVMAMKRLVMEGRWRANEPGSVLWVMGEDQGVYLVWPEMAEDVTHLLHQDGTPGIPSNPYLFAEILEEHGLLGLAPNGNRLWRLWPAAVDAGEQGLLALRLKEPGYIMDLVPPAVPGQILAEEEEPPCKPPDDQATTKKPTESKPKKPKGRLGITDDRTPESPEIAPEPEALTTPPSPGILEEPESPQDPRTLEELQDYFAGGGLGGRALLTFAGEVSQKKRCDGADYKSGPWLLLSWGDQKFTEETSLPEVIESMARADWLVLNGSRRVHEEPGFGKCLKLRERETALFWRLVWYLGKEKPDEEEPETGASSAEPEGGHIAMEMQSHEKPAGSPPPGPPAISTVAEIPEWVSEVGAMLDKDGPLDYDLVKDIVANHTDRIHGLFGVVSQYFVAEDVEGQMMILRRKF